MKKRIGIISLIVLSFCLMNTTKAITVGHTVDNIAGGNVPSIRDYTANMNGTKYVAYCLDPGRQWGYGANKDVTFNLDRIIDPSKSQTQEPSWYLFDLAITYAYQKMIDNGWTGMDAVSQAIGTTAFRIIGIHTGHASTSYRGSLYDTYLAYRDLNLRGAHVQQGIDLAQAAIKFANDNVNTPYQNLIGSGLLKGVNWTTEEYSTKNMAGNKYQVIVHIKPTTTSIYNVDVNQTTIGFNNLTIGTPTITNKSVINGNELSFIIEFDGTNWNKEDLGLYVNAIYCDPYSAASNVYLLNNGNNNQRMIVVLPGSKGTCFSRNTRGGGGGTIHIQPQKTCICDQDANGNYTGKYRATYKNDPSFTMEYDDSRKGEYNCPDSKTCVKQPDNNCKKPSNSTDGKYHCKNGDVCPEEEYKKQCTHSCQTPENSGDNKYYCKESSPDAGDGKECSKNEYEVQCEGKKNCNPTITMPSDCNDTEIESDKHGYISDINKIESTCNHDTNEIKQCVIDNTDLTQQSLQDTSEDVIANNPYCKVWCEEAFDFKLPTARLSDSGGYFKIEATVSGERNCYVSGAADTTKPIDETKFNSDLTEATKRVIDAWNEYAELKARADVTSTSVTTSCSYSKTETESCGTNPDGSECKTSVTKCSGSESGTGYKKTWSWITYDTNGNSSHHSDSYGPGDGNDSSNSCSCSANGDPNTDSQDIINAAEAKSSLILAINAMNKIIVQYNDCSGSVNNTKISDLASTNADSTGWKNNFDFNPTVTYNYNQDYMNKMTGTMEGFAFNPNSSDSYCKGDTDDKYNCLESTSSTVPTKKLKYLRCDESSCHWDESTINISAAKWIKKTKTNKGTYRPNNDFSTYSQYGTVKFDTGNNYIYSKLPADSLPISLITETGVFPFVINYSNIGQSNSTGEANGRLIGQSVSVLTKYVELPESEKCSDEETMEQNIGYVCHYLNNCTGDCDFKCDDDNNCQFTGDNCKDGKCILTCKNCIFDGEKNTFSYRTVSLNKLFPNERTDENSGYNWNNQYKGEATRQEIEENSDTIYEKPEYSYTLTPTNLKNIREYNKTVGSYKNTKTIDNEPAISCSNISLSNGEDTINYPVKCTSTFLDMIEGLENGESNYSRYKNKYAQNDSIIRPELDERFILADQIEGCNDFVCVNRTNHIGPAWK